jgi:hypothetical protein
MRAKLGDTITFSYSAPGIHDKNPQIFFLAKVGHLIHGLNQHYQTPSEKTYYFYLLKKLFYSRVKTGMISAQDFYKNYIKNRLLSDSYRTYNTKYVAGVQQITNWEQTQKVDIRLTKPPDYYKKGDKVRFVSINKQKLSWKQGKIIGRKVPGNRYVVELPDGSTVVRHPSDLRKT